MVMLVHTVETGTFLMEIDCHFMGIILWLKEDNSSELSFIKEQGVVVYHLVSIAVTLRPEQSTVLTTQLERQSLWDCMAVEVIELHIINPRRACAARVTVVVLCVCVSVCVCVCVYDYSRTTGYEAAYERYQQLQCYKGRKNNVAILLKRLRSRDMA